MKPFYNRFEPPIEISVLGDITIKIPAVYWNSKGEAKATVELYNGSLCDYQILEIGYNKARRDFSSKQRMTGKIPDDNILEGSLNDALLEAANELNVRLPEILSHQTRANKGAEAGLFGQFVSDSSGLWRTTKDPLTGVETDPTWICSAIEVAAHTRDEFGEAWGRLLEVRDLEGCIHRWSMPMRMLAGDGREYLSVLLDMGLLISSAKSSKSLLTTFIQTAPTVTYARSVDRVGWYGSAFILPDEVIGSTGDELGGLAESGQSAASDAEYLPKGTLEGWQQEVSALCADNPILTFSVSIAFAGPLLAITGDENGGFHLRGPSSKGKSTATLAAASVYGSRSFVNTWRATSNGLEAVAVRTTIRCSCSMRSSRLIQRRPARLLICWQLGLASSDPIALVARGIARNSGCSFSRMGRLGLRIIAGDRAPDVCGAGDPVARYPCSPRNTRSLFESARVSGWGSLFEATGGSGTGKPRHSAQGFPREIARKR